MGNKQGQVSIEFLIIVGFAMLLTLPLMYIFFRQSETMSSDISSSQADRIASELRDAADEVYYLGEPSKKTITVYLPKDVTAISFQGNTIVINISATSGESEIVKVAASNFSSLSTISPNPGIKKIFAEATANGVWVNETS